MDLKELVSNSEPDSDERRLDTIKFLSVEEINRLLDSITSIRDKTIFTIAYYHGLRASEVGLLKEKDYNNEAKQIALPRKKKGRFKVHDLSEDQVKLLNKWMKVRGKHGDNTPLFPSRQGRPISRGMLDVLMKKYGRLINLPKDKCHFHVLRHSCAVHMVQISNMNLLWIRDWLGHKAYKSTLVYANVSDKALSTAAEMFYKSKEPTKIDKRRKGKAKGIVKEVEEMEVAVKLNVDWSKDKKKGK